MIRTVFSTRKKKKTQINRITLLVRYLNPISAYEQLYTIF